VSLDAGQLHLQRDFRVAGEDSRIPDDHGASGTVPADLRNDAPGTRTSSRMEPPTVAA